MSLLTPFFITWNCWVIKRKQSLWVFAMVGFSFLCPWRLAIVWSCSLQTFVMANMHFFCSTFSLTQNKLFVVVPLNFPWEIIHWSAMRIRVRKPERFSYILLFVFIEFQSIFMQLFRGFVRKLVDDGTCRFWFISESGWNSFKIIVQDSWKISDYEQTLKKF